MSNKLEGKRVAILVEKGFEEVELTSPKAALMEAGATAQIVSPTEGGKVRAWNESDWGDEFFIDVPLNEASADNYDALLLPGGVMNPDKLRANSQAVEFVRTFVQSGKPIAAICHGPWMLIEAGAVKGRTLTSYPSLRTDIRNAGGAYVDQEVVTDSGIVTSRTPDDLPAFNRKMIEEIAEGKHDRNNFGSNTKREEKREKAMSGAMASKN